jgi:hypothetical protein
LISLNKVDVGYMVRTATKKKQLAGKKASGLQVIAFKKRAWDFMQAIVKSYWTRVLSGMALVGT